MRALVLVVVLIVAHGSAAAQADPVTHDPAALADAARRELEQGGADLRGMTLAIAHGDAGYRLVLASPRCARERFLGPLDGSFEAAVAKAVTATASVLVEEHPCGGASDPVAERAVVLADVLSRKAPHRPAAWIELGAAALAAIAAGVLADDVPEQATAFQAASAITLLGGGVLGLLLADADAERAVNFAAIAGLSLFYTSLAWSGPNEAFVDGAHDVDEFHEAFLIAGIAGGFVAWMVLEDGISATDESATEQLRLRRRIDTPRERARLSPDALRAAEAELARASDGRPAWHYAVPLLIGGAAEWTLAYWEENSEERDAFVLCGGVLVANGLLVLLVDLARDRYRSRVDRLKIDVTPTAFPAGAGVGIRGSF